MGLETSWLDKWVAGFILTKQADGCSPETIQDYQRAFNHLARWSIANGKSDVGALTTSDVRAFLAYLRTLPNRYGGTHSPKSVYNVWVALRSFFRWYSAETSRPNPTLQVPAPKTPETIIEPLSRDEVARIVKACDATATAKTDRRAAFAMKRETVHRDRAIVVLLLDTGLRATELCRLTVGDVELSSGRATVRQGKGGKDRVVYLGKSARKVVWRYLSERTDSRPSDALFVTREGREVDRDRLGKLFANLGERAGVAGLHPHRLRHTFATEFLRNGGNLLSLQRLLGHSSLEMVRHYAAIVEADLARAHETGSPADRWHL
jgi:integrase/recombinase XerD